MFQAGANTDKWYNEVQNHVVLFSPPPETINVLPSEYFLFGIQTKEVLSSV